MATSSELPTYGATAADSFVADLKRVLPHLAVNNEKLDLMPVTGDLRAAIDRLVPAVQKAADEARTKVSQLVNFHFEGDGHSPLIGSISVFEALGFHRQELAHTRSLGWLLSPHAKHGFGSKLLLLLLRSIEQNNPDYRLAIQYITEKVTDELSDIDVSCEEMLSSRCRADVLICGRQQGAIDWCLVLEAKVDAKEGHEQLTKILHACQGGTKLGLFLTPSGSRGTTGDDGWASISYLQWARSLIHFQSKVVGCPGAPFLRMYITGLLEDICGYRTAPDVLTLLNTNSPFELEKLLEEEPSDEQE
jgi:hypothetical protein